MKDLPDSSVLYSFEQITAAIDDLAERVTQRCGQAEWLVICVMHGGLIFTAELLQRLPIKLKQDFVRVTRYRETQTSGDLLWRVRPESDLTGKNILLIDDIFDAGNTLSVIADECLQQGAAVVVTVVLLEKDHDRKVDEFRPDYVGLTCEDQYVFGFGMDIEGYWRNLREIRVLL